MAGFLSSIFFFILLLLFINQLTVLVIHLPVAATDTNTDVLRQGHVVADGLVSRSGNFRLGQYGYYTNSYSGPVYYLGICYTDDQTLNKLLWIANREPMFNCCRAIMLLDESGSLKMFNYATNKTVFDIYINSNELVGTRAVLEDSGNFVLYDNKSRVLWQSFDHPTDTLLPGMKLGYNRTTGQSWTLTSWLKDALPALGPFTLKLEHINSSHKLVIYRHGNVYWTSDSWILHGGGLGDFGSFNFGKNNIINGTLVSDDSGMYFSIHKKNISGWRSMMQLSSLGQLIDGEKIFLTPSMCYGYAYDGNNKGCAVSALHKCRDKYDSIQLQGGFWKGRKLHSDDNSNSSLTDCMEICWKDCSCRGFSLIDRDVVIPPNTFITLPAGCYTFGVHADFTKSSSSTTVIDSGVLISQKLPKKKKSKTWIWVVSAAIVVPALFAAFLYYLRLRKRRLEEIRRDDYIHQLTTGSESFNYGDELVKGVKDAAPNVNIFSFKDILAATHNFSDENKLGQGGYGPVYKLKD